MKEAREGLERVREAQQLVIKAAEAWAASEPFHDKAENNPRATLQRAVWDLHRAELGEAERET